MGKIKVVDTYEIKEFITEDLTFFTIKLINYNALLSKQEILENPKYENELIKNLQFLSILENELEQTFIDKIELNKIDDIEKKCWKRDIIKINGSYILSNPYLNERLKRKLMNEYHKHIKYSNQKYKIQVINNNLKTKNERKQYESWKKDYFSKINNKTTTINKLEQFKHEVNSIDLQNQPVITDHRATCSIL